jgi:hypothetical protein
MQVTSNLSGNKNQGNSIHLLRSLSDRHLGHFMLRPTIPEIACAVIRASPLAPRTSDDTEFSLVNEVVTSITTTGGRSIIGSQGEYADFCRIES